MGWRQGSLSSRVWGRLIVLFWLSVSSVQAAPAHSVTLWLSADQAPYVEVADAIGQRLAVAGVESRRQAVGDAPNGKPAALSIGVGMRGCRQALAEDAHTAVLCTLVPEVSFRVLRAQHAGRQLSAILIDQPVSRYLHLIRALLPEARSIGVPLAASDSTLRAQLEQAAALQGVPLEVAAIDDEREAVRAIEGLIDRNDVLLALFAPEILTPRTAKWLLLLAHEGQRPVIGYSQALVTAGAMAGLYTPFAELGQETAELALAFLHGETRLLPPPRYPWTFAVGINAAVARNLGFALPPASDLEQRVRILEAAAE